MHVQTLRTDVLFAPNRAVVAEARALDVDFRTAETIHGLINPREGMLLYVLARRAALLGDVVEIGAYLGRSTWYLARALEDARSPHRLISIDPHLVEGQETSYFDTLQRTGIADRVDARVGYSYEVVATIDAPVGMLWIDGDHEYEAARRDFDEWFPKLAEGGWFAMHDAVAGWPGTQRLARELIAERDDLDDLGVVWLTLFGRKAAAGTVSRPRILHRRLAYEVVAQTQATRAKLRHRRRLRGAASG
jgi:predicted O-methyltransferase YrrM